MKHPKIAILVLIAGGILGAARAANLEGESLNIAAPNTTNSSLDSQSSGTIGSGNWMSSGSSSLMVGNENSLSNSWCSLLAGYGNSSEALYAGMVIGFNNSILNTNGVGGSGLVAGGYNTIDSAWLSFVFGENNYVTGGIHNFILGEGIVVNGTFDVSQIVVGSYNVPVANQLFVVANGPDYNNRHNALEIYQNGDINIPGGKLSLFGATASTPSIVLDPSASQITINGRQVLTSGYSGNLSLGDSGPLLSSPWKGAQAIGNGGYDKVVSGPLSSSYTGATIGAHNSALNAWANLNIAGQNLIFRTNGESEAVRIDSSGRLGIGINNPSYKLSVNGTIQAADFGDRGSVNLLIGDDSYLTDVDAANTLGLYGAYNAAVATLVLGTSGASISGANENIGIGTINPEGKLQVKGSAVWDGTTAVNITNGATDYGRTTLRLTGRLQDGNEGWAAPGGARNSIVFATNAAGGGQNIGAVGSDKFAVQYNMSEDKIGFVGADGSRKLVIGQDGVITMAKRQGDIVMGEFGNGNGD